jgi:Flp pilus assembly protein protease CpaA
MLTRRIPNAITYPAMVLGLGLNSLGLLLPASSQGAALVQSWLGAAGPLSSLAGLGVCAVIGVLGFAVRGLGGGDAKLLGAIGALAGAPGVFPILCNILVVASARCSGGWTASPPVSMPG